jgi:hypothetical protein
VDKNDDKTEWPLPSVLVLIMSCDLTELYFLHFLSCHITNVPFYSVLCTEMNIQRRGGVVSASFISETSWRIRIKFGI